MEFQDDRRKDQPIAPWSILIAWLVAFAVLCFLLAIYTTGGFRDDRLLPSCHTTTHCRGT